MHDPSAGLIADCQHLGEFGQGHREIGDAREGSAAKAIGLRDHQGEQVINLREPHGEHASVQSAVRPAEIDEPAET